MSDKRGELGIPPGWQGDAHVSVTSLVGPSLGLLSPNHYYTVTVIALMPHQVGYNMEN